MDTVKVTGMVLSAMPIGDYDKRLVILTKERGKVTAFAKGAKRTNSRFLAGSRPFSFGEFTLYPGRNAYNVEEMHISQYFDELAKDVYDTYYGFYFLELADYFTVEGIEETQTLKLLYQSLRALENKNIPNGLVCSVFELKLLVIHGEYPDFFACQSCGSHENLVLFSFSQEGVYCRECQEAARDKFYFGDSVLYTLQYIVSTGIDKLYTFTVSEAVLKDLQYLVRKYRQKKIDKKLKALEILETLVKAE